MSKIARITADKKLLLSNEIIEGDKVSLNADGTLYVNEVIEDDKFSINSNGIEVTELIEDYILEPSPDTYIDVYGFGRLVLPPDGALDEMRTENVISLDTEIPLVYFSTLEYHVVNISNVIDTCSISLYHHNIIERIDDDYNFFDSSKSLITSRDFGVDDNNKSFIDENEYVFKSLPHTDGSGTNYKTIEEIPAGKLGYYLRIDGVRLGDFEVEGVVTVRKGSPVGDIIYRDGFRLLVESMCYLTTAMVSYFGKDDDGIELNSMRKLREYYKDKHADTLAEYYQVSPIIIRGIEQSSNKDYYYNMIKDVVDNIVIWVADEEWERAETAYLELYYYLKEKFGGV